MKRFPFARGRTALFAPVMMVGLPGCQAAELPPTVVTVPIVRRIETFTPGSHGPELLRGAPAVLDVSENGSVVFTAGHDSAGRLVTLVDSNGAVVSRFGMPGQGPEEIGGAINNVALTDSTVTVFSMTPPRFTVFGYDGRFRRGAAAPPRAIPVSFHGDSVDVAEMWFGNLSAMRVVGFKRVAIGGGSRTLIDSTNAEFRAFRLPPPDRPGTSIPLFAANAGGFVILNTTTRRLRGYDANGQQRYEADSLTITGKPLLDSQDRLWVIVPRADSLRAAVSHAGRPLTELTFGACRENWAVVALRGSWLVIACRDSQADSEIDLRLYRIE